MESWYEFVRGDFTVIEKGAPHAADVIVTFIATANPITAPIAPVAGKLAGAAVDHAIETVKPAFHAYIEKMAQTDQAENARHLLSQIDSQLIEAAAAVERAQDEAELVDEHVRLNGVESQDALSASKDAHLAAAAARDNLHAAEELAPKARSLAHAIATAEPVQGARDALKAANDALRVIQEKTGYAGKWADEAAKVRSAVDEHLEQSVALENQIQPQA